MFRMVFESGTSCVIQLTDTTVERSTLELSKRAVRQNWLMLAVAVASAVAAILSVCIAMRG